MNKLISLSIFSLFMGSFVNAETTKTDNPVDIAISQAQSVYNLKHRLPSKSKQPQYDDLRVIVTEKDGSHTNPLGTVYVLIAGTEDGVEPGGLHKFSTSMSRVESVTNRWVNANNSSAGGYIFINGRRMDPEKNILRSYRIEIKYTDSTNVYLDDLMVNAGYVNEK